MYTSVTLVALSGFLIAAPNENGPSWRDYRTGAKQGKEQRKPLAVFFGSGKQGYQQVSSDGKLSKEMRDILTQKYVCVYVDTSKEADQRWARAFRLETGLVISDSSGNIQAFRHDGTLGNRDLKRYLERFSDPDLEVQSTATHVTERVSYYQPSAPQAQSPFIGSFGGGRSC